MLLQTLLSFYRAAPTSDCAGVRWVAAAVSIKQLYRRINCAGTQDERRHHHCHQPLHQCPWLHWPLSYIQQTFFYRQVFGHQCCFTVEKGSQKQTIHTLEPATVFCHTFKSHLVLRGAGVCQVGKNISCHHCRLSGQFGLSVDINPYISSFSQYLVIYTATTTRTPTTQYIAFHTWRHQRRTLLENGHKNQDLK